MWKYFLVFLFQPFLAVSLAFAQATGQVDFTNVVPDIANSQGTGGAGFIGWIQAFYQFSLIAGVFLAVGVITWAGLKYALAAGNPSGQSDARDQILQALLGLILLFGAYLILFTINPNLTNLSLPTLSSVSVGAPATPPLDNGWQTGTGDMTNAQATTILGQNRVGVKDCIGVSGNCVPASLEGIKRSTVDGVIALKNDCGCGVMVTSGTDSHTTGGHVTGDKVDLRIDNRLNTFLEKPENFIGLRCTANFCDNAPMYRGPGGGIYAREGNHWDVSYKGA